MVGGTVVGGAVGSVTGGTVGSVGAGTLGVVEIVGTVGVSGMVELAEVLPEGRVVPPVLPATELVPMVSITGASSPFGNIKISASAINRPQAMIK